MYIAKVLFTLAIIAYAVVHIVKADDTIKTKKDDEIRYRIEDEIIEGQSEDSYRYANMKGTRRVIILQGKAKTTRYDHKAKKIGHLNADLIIFLYDMKENKRVMTVANGNVDFNKYNIYIKSERSKLYYETGIAEFAGNVVVKHKNVYNDMKEPDELHAPYLTYNEFEDRLFTSGGVKFKIHMERITTSPAGDSHDN